VIVTAATGTKPKPGCSAGPMAQLHNPTT